jgi:catechol 2,3-dioxygenase-like lactoylglutathione lyase family enzyme
MIRGIHHTAISTGDLERALGFYRDLLGFEVVFEVAWPKGTEPADQITALRGSAARIAMLRAGNTYLELFEYESPPPATGDPERPVCDHGITHIALDVRDIDAEYERLSAAGMHFHCPPLDLGLAKATYGRDPDGNVIELQEILTDDSPMALDLD